MCELNGGGFMKEEAQGTSCACSEGGKTLTCSDSTCEYVMPTVLSALPTTITAILSTKPPEKPFPFATGCNT
jgi:hypothetical protein